MDKRKSNILTFSSGKVLANKKLPIFRKRLSIACYILIAVVVFGSCFIDSRAAMEQELNEPEASNIVSSNIISPDVPYNNELTSINYRFEELQKSVDEQTGELKEINQNLALAVELLSLILGSITLVIIACTFLGICRWLYHYLRFDR